MFRWRTTRKRMLSIVVYPTIAPNFVFIMQLAYTINLSWPESALLVCLYNDCRLLLVMHIGGIREQKAFNSPCIHTLHLIELWSEYTEWNNDSTYTCISLYMYVNPHIYPHRNPLLKTTIRFTVAYRYRISVNKSHTLCASIAGLMYMDTKMSSHTGIHLLICYMCTRQ